MLAAAPCQTDLRVWALAPVSQMRALAQVPLVEMHALRNRQFLVVFAGAWLTAGTFRLLM
jgi:hypothetical protein